MAKGAPLWYNRTAWYGAKEEHRKGKSAMFDDTVGSEEEYSEYRYDTQLLIEGQGLDEDEIRDYFTEHFKGDCLLAVGDDELIKIHFHTNEPWKVLEYCRSLGEIFDIVVEDMFRQARGLKG